MKWSADYLLKPFSRNAILRSVGNAARVCELAREKRQLEEANENYRHDLEHLVEQRTEELRETNVRLRGAMEGTIQAVDFGANTLIFEGVRFQVLPDAEVEIRGSYGAFTMLQAGMKAVVTYRVVSESERHVIRVVQLPDNYRLEGA